jgi:phage terminase small subunit
VSRPRSECREQALSIYLEHEGKIKLKDLADQMEVPDSRIRKWKAEDKWDDKLKGALLYSKGSAPKRKGAPKGNQHAKGNRGGGAPKNNRNAEKHGFFSRIFPDDEETRTLLDEIRELSPLDIIWSNIRIQMLAIARAQKIMWVTDKEEMIKELKRSYEKNTVRSTEKTSTQSDECEYEYEFQFAWDRQATLLKAQSRAMSELRGLIKQYEEMLRQGYGDEEQRLRIEKLKAEVEQIKSPVAGDDLADLLRAAWGVVEDAKATD